MAGTGRGTGEGHGNALDDHGRGWGRGHVARCSCKGKQEEQGCGGSVDVFKPHSRHLTVPTPDSCSAPVGLCVWLPLRWCL